MNERVTMQKWIRTRNETPDDGRIVLVTYRIWTLGAISVTLASYKKHKKEWDAISGISIAESDVIAWMEAPEPFMVKCNEENFYKVCQALVAITNQECSDYGFEEACDIADDYLEQRSNEG